MIKDEGSALRFFDIISIIKVEEKEFNLTMKLLVIV